MKQSFFIFFIFIVFFQTSNAQIFKNTAKNYWAADLGVTYHYEDKNVYKSSDRFDFRGQITPYPGVYNYPTTTVHTSLFRNFNLKREFYFGIGMMYYNRISKSYSPPDTVVKYTVFHDSIVQRLPFEQGHWPVYGKRNLNSVRLSFSLGYQLNRFFVFYRGHFSIASFNFYNNKYLNNIEKKYFDCKFFFDASSYDMPSLGLQFQVLKNKPIYIYIIYNNNYLSGIEYRF